MGKFAEYQKVFPEKTADEVYVTVASDLIHSQLTLEEFDVELEKVVEDYKEALRKEQGE